MEEERIAPNFTDEQIHAAQKEHAKKQFLAGIVLLAAAVLCVLAGVLSAGSSKKIAAYPTAQARVLRCDAVTATREDEKGEQETYVEHYNVDIEYTVDGQTYTQTGRHSDKPLEGIVTVYYNPDKPQKAYFEAQAQGESNVYWYVIGGIVGVVGLVVFIGGTKEKRKLKGERQPS
jgi:hypothetical protein